MSRFAPCFRGFNLWAGVPSGYLSDLGLEDQLVDQINMWVYWDGVSTYPLSRPTDIAYNVDILADGTFSAVSLGRVNGVVGDLAGKAEGYYMVTVDFGEPTPFTPSYWGWIFAYPSRLSEWQVLRLYYVTRPVALVALLDMQAPPSFVLDDFYQPVY